MGQDLEKLQILPFEDLIAHPERIADILSKNESVPIFLRKDGATLSVGALPFYPRATDRILEEALVEYAEMKRHGYGRADGFAEHEALLDKLAGGADKP
jgi:hypothetical protein